MYKLGAVGSEIVHHLHLAARKLYILGPATWIAAGTTGS